LLKTIYDLYLGKYLKIRHASAALKINSVTDFPGVMLKRPMKPNLKITAGREEGKS
jgi:hypothetical protein